MSWTFRALRRYTVAESLIVDGVPRTAKVDIGCSGGGCPAKSTTRQSPSVRVCKGKGERWRCRIKPARRLAA